MSRCNRVSNLGRPTSFDEKIKTLIENVQDHVEEENSVLVRVLSRGAA